MEHKTGKSDKKKCVLLKFKNTNDKTPRTLKKKKKLENKTQKQ